MEQKQIMLECNRLVYNDEFELIEEQWDKLGLPIPEEEKVEKYKKFQFFIGDVRIIKMFYQDDEMLDHTIILIDDMIYLIDVNYKVLIQKYKEAGVVLSDSTDLKN